eukprot:m51a1_g12671 hypothetical protein (407) ;mRNA; r:947-2578
MSINDVQVKGTQMSFHQASPSTIAFWNYTHSSLLTQLSDQNVRAVELKFRFEGGDFVVYNVRGVDGLSSCPNVSKCMQQVYQHTLARPKHPLLFVVVEPAHDSAAAPVEWTQYLWDWLDSALSISWPSSQIVTPKEVLGDFASLSEAVLSRGWPSLSSSVGRMMFLLRVNGSNYFPADGPGKRVAFPIFRIGSADPNAVVFEEPDPVLRYKDIQKAVRRNFLVLTRSDWAFIPSGVSAFDEDAFLKAADSNMDGAVGRDEAVALFVDGFWDAAEPAASAARAAALDTAIYQCAGADAKEIPKASFGCLSLPTPEGLVGVRARYAAALTSGAQVVTTKYAAAPFKGAPASLFWWSDLVVGCNPVLACECDMASMVASDICTAPSPRASPGVAVVASLAAVAYAVLVR